MADSKKLHFEPNVITYRGQNDGLGDEVSLITGLACDPDEDRTRQEFAEDSDVNTILRKFGAIPPSVLAPRYGTIDFDLDLQAAHERTRMASVAFSALPEGLREAFPDWTALAAALANGQVEISPVKPNEKAGGGSEVPSDPPPASPAAASTNPFS